MGGDRSLRGIWGHSPIISFSHRAAFIRIIDGLMKIQIPWPTPRASHSSLGWGRIFSFIEHPQVRLILLVCEPHLENRIVSEEDQGN